MKQILTDDERKRIDAKIVEVEKRTSTQIVLAVVQRCDSYVELPWKAFALGASLSGLLVYVLNLIFSEWVSDITVAFATGIILAAGAVFSLFTIVIPGVARWFLSDHRTEVEVKQYAESMFLSRELFATSKRTGILLLVSLFERRVVILPDTGLRDQFTSHVMENIISHITGHLKRGDVGQAFETGLTQISRSLETMEKENGSKNELSDEIIEEKGV